MDLPAWSPNCVELTKQSTIAGFMHTVKNSSRFLRVLEPTAEVGIAVPGICARRQNPLRKQPAKGAGGGDPEWECEYQTQGRALPLLLKKCLVGLVTDVAATRWIVSRRSLDSAEQGPESKQQSPGFLIPTATHIKPGWFSSHRSRPGPPLRPVPCFCRVLFGNIIHIALMYAF